MRLGVLTRFIPAPAGNMGGSSPRLARRNLPNGSSPRLRGTCGRPHAVPRCTVHPRACGEHHSAHRENDPTAVHPRACGEHDHKADRPRNDFEHGSSPRLRGTWCMGFHCWERLASRLVGGSSPRLRGTYIILTDCYSVGYMLLKIGTNDLAPDSSPTSAKHIHIIQAKRIRDGDHQNPQVSGDLCQRSQT